MALGHIDQWLILFAIALIHNHVANALHCGNTVQNIQLEQFCDCQVDCKNQYDEIGCAPINATAVQNSVTSCKGNSCSLNDGIVYTQLCKPLTCPLWKFDTRTQSTQNASCVKLPCIAGCLCGLSYMKCESGRRTKSIKRMMIPYQHVLVT
ncbi:uncharacterized protein TRIADDRAFT_61215 [Trichoplax adhaerens]|uniref:Uncharacterized protein n=1 Tax=Trichoplax adhaerens TaxID=10228 RepID=B3SAC7_TRIAD|nr:predicted protein [Trichoplax adhaerens]EDV20291.1 predicted protein [Trichoplax adhaerens]|eukprot:XP_002117241.1 predicted protein [Trichoplax adhaerens]